MIARLIATLTGRSYAIDGSDLGYLLAKGGIPFLRGMRWTLVRLRKHPACCSAPASSSSSPGG